MGLLARLFKRTKETIMAKKEEETAPNVVWTLTDDGLEPAPAPWGFIARNPIQKVIAPRGGAVIQLLVSANVPMLCFPRTDLADAIEFESPILLPGKKLTITVKNASEHSPLVLDDREALVNLHPMVFSGRAVVG